MIKTLLLINSVAGKAQLVEHTYQMIEYLTMHDCEVTVVPIHPAKGLDGTRWLEQRPFPFELVVCAGGDGTLNHTINELMKMEERPILGYVPAGSTNDFARGIGITGGIDNALKIIGEGCPFTYDIGRFNDKFFNYVAAFGAFSEISYSTKQELKNVLGYAAYMLSALMELHQNLHFKCHLQVQTDSFTEEGDYVFGAVSNSMSVGGMKLFENVNIHLADGKMELLLIQAPDNPIEMQMIIGALGLGNMDHPKIRFCQTKELRIKSQEPLAWTLDGEFGGEEKEAVIRVEEKALTVMSGREEG